MRRMRGSPRFWNRLLAGMVILLLLVVGAGVVYDTARVDAILQGRLNIAQAEIDANGLTLAQAEADIARVLRTDRADITALQQKVAALEAQNAQLEAQIAALQAALSAQGSSPSPSGNGGTAPPPPPPQPSAKPTPTPRGHSAAPTPCLLGIVCFGAPAAQCPPHHHHC